MSGEGGAHCSLLSIILSRSNRDENIDSLESVIKREPQSLMSDGALFFVVFDVLI